MDNNNKHLTKIYKIFFRKERKIGHRIPLKHFKKCVGDMHFTALLNSLEKSGKYYLNLGALQRFYLLHIQFTKRVKRMREFREEGHLELEEITYPDTVFLVKLEQLKRKFK